MQQVLHASQRRCIAHGTADLDWGSLLFNHVPTNCHIEYLLRQSTVYYVPVGFLRRDAAVLSLGVCPNVLLKL